LPFESVAGASNAGSPITATEKTTHYERELGYQVTPQLMLMGNLYLMEVDDFIGFDPTLISSITLGDITTKGLELIANWRSELLIFDASYSLFQIADTNITEITVAADDDAILATPNHMLKLSSSYLLDNRRSINVTGTAISSRYACVDDPFFTCGEPQKLDREIDLKVFYRYSSNSLSYNIGVANILDEEIFIAQPYRGSQSPIPILGRRLMLDFSYQF